MRERIESRERIYDGKIVKLDLLSVELPDGKRSAREVINHPGAVAIVGFVDSDTIALVRQYRIAADDILLELPAGTLEPGEEPAVCAEREMQEETGFKPGKLHHLGGIHAAPGYTTEFIHLFVATDLTPSTLPGDDDEFIEVVPVSVSEALRLIDSGQIQDGKTVSGILRALRWRDQS